MQNTPRSWDEVSSEYITTGVDVGSIEMVTVVIHACMARWMLQATSEVYQAAANCLLSIL